MSKFKDWEIDKEGSPNFLRHWCPTLDYPKPCIKVNSIWVCQECKIKAPLPIQYIADLSFLTPEAKLNTKNKEDFMRCWCVLRWFWSRPDFLWGKWKEPFPKEALLLCYNKYAEKLNNNIWLKEKVDELIELFIPNS